MENTDFKNYDSYEGMGAACYAVGGFVISVLMAIILILIAIF